MTPLGRMLDAALDAGRPAGKLLTRPTAIGRNRPFYALNVLGRLRGSRELESAVQDRIVMVTGASSGIGAATAQRLGEAGGEVVLVARTTERLEETAAGVRSSGGVAHVYPCDLNDLEAVGELADRVQAELGRVDILVNNAGRSIRRSLQLSYDRVHDYQRTMQLNYFSPVRLMLGLLPGMRERRFGHVVNVSSAGVQMRVPRFGAYIASKAALDILCDAWQAETRADNVHFTTVHMGLVRTPMIQATTIYERFPALSPAEAAQTICQAMLHRPRRVTSTFGQVAAFADALSPQIMDLLRSQGYGLFNDSRAARGDSDGAPDAPIGIEERLFAGITRGVHW